MRTNSIIVVLAVFALCAGSSAFGQANCSGGTTDGIEVSDTIILTNDEVAVADDLHFKVWQKECWIFLNGWNIDVTAFNTLACAGGFLPAAYTCSGEQAGDHDVDADASVGSVPILGTVQIDATFWLTSGNAINFSDIKWTGSGIPDAPTAPPFGWELSGAIDLGGGVSRHQITLYNHASVAIHMLGVEVLASATNYADLTFVPFPGGGEDYLIEAGGSVTFQLDAGASGEGTYIYLTFDVHYDDGGNPGPLELINIGKHEVYAQTDPIPTLSQWGMIILAALLVLTGSIAILRMRGRATA